ncbi:MAG: type II toxin-antitoxin system VapC family toxin [Desulfurococcales archaeon]|nr:type II toxin-antitoxin system VapC family toxin [Desulfurococcales archaeon]
MTKSSMGSVVLDTTVIVKSILKPPRHLPPHVYRREVETQKKIHDILEVLESQGHTVYFPRAGIVEVAAVLKRGGLSRQAIIGLVKSMEETFIIVGEDIVYGKAFEIALERAPSGFDTYFIALAAITNSTLVTDDKPMASHAKALGIETILVRETSLEQIRRKLTKQPK